MRYVEVEAKLRPYQMEAVRHLLSRNKACDWDDMGLGKTLTILTAIEKRRVHHAPFISLILCPRNALYVWQGEIAKWFNQKAIVYAGTPKQRTRLWDDFLADPECDYLITTYAMLKEIMDNTLRDKHCGKFLPVSNNPGHGWATIAADEIHLAGLLNHKTATYKLFFKYTSDPEQVTYLATGTPTRKGMLNMFAPLHIMDPKRFSNYWGFVNRHCITIDTPFGKSIEMRPRYPEEFREILKEYAIRRLKSDVLDDLPGKQRVPFYVKMTDRQQAYYDDLVKDMFIVTEEGEFVAAQNAMVLQLRLKQLLVCPMLLGIDEYGAALQAVAETGSDLVEGGESFVVFTPYKEALPYIKKCLQEKISNLRIYQLSGGMTGQAFAEQWQGFLNDKSPRRVLLCVIKSGASFQAYTSAKCFFLGYEEDFNHNAQAEDRLCRMGQKEFVLAYYMMHKDTVEEAIAQRLDDKQEANDWIVGTEEQFELLKARYQMRPTKK